MAASSPEGDRATATPPVSGETMQAIVQRQYGGAEVLHPAEVDRPVIGAAEVLVQVKAAGLDRGTWHLMAGRPAALRLAFGLRKPKNPVPGFDVAGLVVAVGDKVTRFQPGDEVFGISKGSFAQFSAAKESKLALKPPNLSFEQAAAVPISGLTALGGVCDSGRLEAGQRVLITGASGGVGTYAVQLAKALGATVTGVCSTGKLDLVKEIGADHVIDYTREDFADRGEKYDLIVDIAGNTSLSRLRRALEPRGTLVITGGEGGGRWFGGIDRQLRAIILSRFIGQRLTTFIATEDHAGLERLRPFLEDGRVVPVIGRTYPLSDAPAAMRDLVAGEARGKLVITV